MMHEITWTIRQSGDGSYFAEAENGMTFVWAKEKQELIDLLRQSECEFRDATARGEADEQCAS